MAACSPPSTGTPLVITGRTARRTMAAVVRPMRWLRSSPTGPPGLRAAPREWASSVPLVAAGLTSVASEAQADEGTPGYVSKSPTPAGLRGHLPHHG